MIYRCKLINGVIKRCERCEYGSSCECLRPSPYSTLRKYKKGVRKGKNTKNLIYYTYQHFGVLLLVAAGHKGVPRLLLDGYWWCRWWRVWMFWQTAAGLVSFLLTLLVLSTAGLWPEVVVADGVWTVLLSSRHYTRSVSDW